MEYCCAMSWTCATCGLNVGLRSRGRRQRTCWHCLLLCSCVLLLFTAAEAALGGSGLRSPFVDWGLFVTLIAAAVPGYRFLIFLVTLYFT